MKDPDLDAAMQTVEYYYSNARIYNMQGDMNVFNLQLKESTAKEKEEKGSTRTERIDATTGDLRRTFQLPRKRKKENTPTWEEDLT
eukprot:4733274-Amphidinium_carterae.4